MACCFFCAVRRACLLLAVSGYSCSVPLARQLSFRPVSAVCWCFAVCFALLSLAPLVYPEHAAFALVDVQYFHAYVRRVYWDACFPGAVRCNRMCNFSGLTTVYLLPWNT